MNDSMRPGRELDVLVVKNVLKWNIKREADGWWWVVDSITNASCFRPSNNIQNAWEVAEKLNRHWTLEYVRLYAVGENILDPTQGKMVYACAFHYKDELYFENGCAETAPHAICLAALNAVGYKAEP